MKMRQTTALLIAVLLAAALALRPLLSDSITDSRATGIERKRVHCQHERGADGEQLSRDARAHVARTFDRSGGKSYQHEALWN